MLINFLIHKLFGKYLLDYSQKLHIPTFKAELERPILQKENNTQETYIRLIFYLYFV